MECQGFVHVAHVKEEQLVHFSMTKKSQIFSHETTAEFFTDSIRFRFKATRIERPFFSHRTEVEKNIFFEILTTSWRFLVTRRSLKPTIEKVTFSLTIPKRSRLESPGCHDFF